MKRILTYIYKRLFLILGTALPKDKKIIVFESFLGKQYSDNPRAIYEYVKQAYPDYRLYWSVEKKSVDRLLTYDITIVKRFSIKWLFIMTRAKYWVSNSRLPNWIPKPRKTIYLQTWHGTPLKRLALDMEEVKMPGTDTTKYKANFIKETSKWDYLISPNKYSADIFTRAFAYKGEILETGYPRNDYLINNNNATEKVRIRKALNLPQNKKVILYAPTWRDNEFYKKGKYKFDLPFNLEEMQKELGDEYLILLRMHYLISENLKLDGHEEFIKDMSNHEDIRELYLISDLLITDYSSVMFDFAILKRPMIFYAYDLDAYRDELRGFYLDYNKELPGPLVRNQEELLKTIKTKKHENYNEEAKIFYQRFNSLEDGNASKRVVNKILQERKDG